MRIRTPYCFEFSVSFVVMVCNLCEVDAFCAENGKVQVHNFLIGQIYQVARNTTQTRQRLQLRNKAISSKRCPR